MANCILCPAPVFRRFAILCQRCMAHVNHDFKRVREFATPKARMAEMDTRERWTMEED